MSRSLVWHLPVATVAAVGLMALRLVSATATGGTAPSQSSPNFVDDVAPIVYANCVVCHRPGKPAPFSLIGYDDVKAKSAEIVEATQTRQMPPWRAGAERANVPLRDNSSLTDRQIATLKTWVGIGMPLGDPRKLKPPPLLPRDWALGVPDITLTLPRRISIPADASARRYNVLLPIGLIQGRWIQAIDFQPTAPAALNHAVFFGVPRDRSVDDEDVLPGFSELMGPGATGNIAQRMIAADQALDVIGTWVPGGWPRRLPPDSGHYLPRYSNIVMQLHALPSETGAIEDGRIAIFFAKSSAAKRVVPILLPPSFGILSGLDIPAGEKRTLSDSFTIPVDIDAVGARGHAHLLARDMKLTAVLPGGRARTLLQIDRWDPRWHDTYYFAAPVRLPRGTVVRSEINYYHSSENARALLNPPRRVAWGPLLTDEIGAIALLVSASNSQDADAIALARSEHFRDQLLKRR